MSRAVHVRFREGVGVRVPRATRLLLGFAGTKEEAEEIRAKIRNWLRDNLKLELSEEKTLIAHATLGAARFLGYDVSAFRSEQRLTVNGHIKLAIPVDIIRDACHRYMRDGKPIHRPERINDSDFDIIAGYGIEYRGLMNYYILAHNIERMTKVHWAMRRSLLMTLANKHKSSVAKMARKYVSTTDTPHGPRKCIKRVIRRPGKEPLVALRWHTIQAQERGYPRGRAGPTDLQPPRGVSPTAPSG
jgi:hypothetical protein